MHTVPSPGTTFRDVPGTYSQLLLHIIFSTKDRAPFITPDIRERLHPYIGGIIRAEEGSLLTIGGMPDHVHLLIRWRTDATIADLMRTVKARSSRWVHRTFPHAQSFRWQEGYSAFSVSKSVEHGVRTYIENQETHHARRSFMDELRTILRAHGVDFDDRYLA